MNIITKFKDLLIDSLKENKKMILAFYAIFFVSFILSAALAGGHMENVIDDIPDSAGGSKDGNVTATELFIHNELGGIGAYIASFRINWGIIKSFHAKRMDSVYNISNSSWNI